MSDRQTSSDQTVASGDGSSPSVAPEPAGETASIGFGDPDLVQQLAVLGDAELDELEFGVIAMDRTGRVVAYNRAESALSGLDAAKVVGRNFFVEIGPCTNNRRVADRFRDHDDLGDLDETIDYVFTYRMAPVRVRLRMLASTGSDRQFLVVEKR